MSLSDTGGPGDRGADDLGHSSTVGNRVDDDRNVDEEGEWAAINIAFFSSETGGSLPAWSSRIAAVEIVFSSSFFEVLQDTPPFSMSKGAFFSRKKSSTASAVRVS